MVRPNRTGVGNAVKAASFLDIVKAVHRQQRGLGVLLLLCLYHFGYVDQLILPGVQRDDFCGLFWNRSGTTPLVIAETIFWRSGA